ncbi:Gfo/Idh/MocA family oxidoreductase [Streptomyces sp. RB6PN25]|uniref:Gfo/Idh/MocA family oxidoreductase n=1 Tax=Streptomyces humicola TaxID=2953240 RepID=A0ABT1PV52_9ACTN|nr:Gfo/Idh/MocA family oxidoreductase [Streptomyces humicola]MCQ4080890.1 Gfo/Idh/MocA family oxidoreductase [Streptomyces humicola]
MRPLVVAVNGVTGRMGRTRHLHGALLPLQRSGIRSAGRRRELDLVLVGRRAAAVSQLAREHGVRRWSTDLDAVLGDPEVDVYFDAQRSGLRSGAVTAAIKARKHLYCEKPLALDGAAALELARDAEQAQIRTGMVQDKLFTPGFRALRSVLAAGALGRILDVRGDFGYWVSADAAGRPQRPSWNYRRADGGDFIADLFSHWYYLLAMVGTPLAVSALLATHVPRRHDESGRPYDVDVEDLGHVLVRLHGGVTGVISTSWIQRPPTPFTLTLHGTRATAMATPDACTLSTATLPAPGATPVPRQQPVPMPPQEDEFLSQWRQFLEHVAGDTPFPWTFCYAARAALFCDAIRNSGRRGTWCDVPEDTGDVR